MTIIKITAQITDEISTMITDVIINEVINGAINEVTEEIMIKNSETDDIIIIVMTDVIDVELRQYASFEEKVVQSRHFSKSPIPVLKILPFLISPFSYLNEPLALID